MSQQSSLYAVPLSILLLVYIQPTNGHIHSQKIRDYGGEAIPLETWALSLISACMIGLCGVVPLFLNKWIRLDKVDGNSCAMQMVLSFAAGGLLGDVWLHLLPESWGADKSTESVRTAGLWVIAGLLSFMSIEKLAKAFEHDSKASTIATTSNGNGSCSDQVTQQSNNFSGSTRTDSERFLDKDISGYLNLIANFTDNFTHGLAIAASYIVNPLVGALTTVAIICHEIPHEVGDFAILLRSGFSIPGAIKAQLVTASGGLVGVMVGLLAEQMGHCTTWMLPFTAGGFLYIAMVSILPELLEQDRHSLRQLFGVFTGIIVMAAVTIIERKSCAAIPYTIH